MEKMFVIDNDETFTATMSQLKEDEYWEDCFDEEDFEKLEELKIGDSLIRISFVNNNSVRFKRVK